jgi:hypothetical protein
MLFRRCISPSPFFLVWGLVNVRGREKESSLFSSFLRVLIVVLFFSLIASASSFLLATNGSVSSIIEYCILLILSFCEAWSSRSPVIFFDDLGKICSATSFTLSAKNQGCSILFFIFIAFSLIVSSKFIMLQVNKTVFLILDMKRVFVNFCQYWHLNNKNNKL